MQFREATSDDIPAILASGVTFNPRVGFEHMAVAEESDGAILGVAKAFRSGLHRTRYWTTVRVVESARLSGIGRELLDILGELRSEPLPFAYRCRADDPAADFIRSVGGHVYQEIPGLRLDLTDDATRAWIHALPTVNDSEIVSGEALSDDELVDAWCDTYTWTHDDWAPVSSRDDVARLFADEVRNELLRDNSSFARSGTELLAGAFVFSTPPSEPLDIVAETVARDVDGGHLTSCVRRTLLSAIEDGWAEVSFEAHNDDPHLTPLIQSAPSVHGTPFYLMEYEPISVNA